MPNSINLVTLLLIVAAIVYVVVRQFTEKQAKAIMLVLVPLLVAYHTYLSIEQEVLHPIVSNSLLIVCFIIGVVPGAILGYFRGNLTRLRFDARTGKKYYRPSVANGLFWLGMLVIKVLAGVGIYLHLDQQSAASAILLAIATTLFLGYVCVTCSVLYLRTSRFSSDLASQGD